MGINRDNINFILIACGILKNDFYPTIHRESVFVGKFAMQFVNLQRFMILSVFKELYLFNDFFSKRAIKLI